MIILTAVLAVHWVPVKSFSRALLERVNLLSDEDPVTLERLSEAILQVFPPQTSSEELLVAELIRHFWLSQRALRFQEIYLESQTDRQAAHFRAFLRMQKVNDDGFHRTFKRLVEMQPNNWFDQKSKRRAGPKKGA